MSERRTIQPLPPESQEYRMILASLRLNHRGAALAISKPDILAGMEVAGWPVGRRVLDETLRAMRARGEPVCGTGAGIFWAENVLEVRAAIHYCSERFDDLRKTIGDYERICTMWGRAEPRVEVRQTELFPASSGRTKGRT